MQDIYLSPHYDDVAFSLSTVIKPSGVILDIFTISNYIENKTPLINCYSVSEIREKEEKRFIFQNNLKYIKLDFVDRDVSHKPLSFLHSVPENYLLEKKLISIIEKFASKTKNNLYCPLGVGKHYDHLQVFNVIQKNYDELSKNFNIIFYAEFPYLLYGNNLKNRKKYLSNWMKSKKIKEMKNQLLKKQVEEKVKNLMNYKSQFKNFSHASILSEIKNIKDKNCYEIMFLCF